MKTRDIAAAQRLERRRIEVRVTSGPDKGLTAVLFDEPLVIGTGPEADLRLTDETVSANHCELSWRDGRLVVRDLASTNGVVLEGTAVAEAFPKDKCKLALAQTTLTLKPLESEEVVLSGRRLFGPLYGESPAMRALFTQLEAVAKSDAPLLLEGETGTGKDLTAEAMHKASARADGPFVVFDCGAAAGTLLESELFGHERGAFTGANAARPGLALAADGGTLLIDEVGEVPLELQPKLLRLLERREVRPLGANETKTVDVRIIAATHRPLRAMVKAGTFREDLFFRLSALRLRLPSLRSGPRTFPGSSTRSSPSMARSERSQAWPTAIVRCSPATAGPATCASCATSSSGSSHSPPPTRRVSSMPTKCRC